MSSFKVIDVFQIKNVGLVVTGTVLEGIIKPGVTGKVNGKTVIAKSIEEFHQPLSEAKPGQKVGIQLDGVSKADVKSNDTIFFG